MMGLRSEAVRTRNVDLVVLISDVTWIVIV